MSEEYKVPFTAEQQDGAAPVQASWRDTIKIHPACKLIPPMSAAELRELGENILKNQLKLPIAVIAEDVPREDGEIFYAGDPSPLQLTLVDGRSRLDALELVTGHPVQVGWKPRARAWIIEAGNWNTSGMVVELDYDIDPYAYVLSVNVHRRHLTAEKKRESIANLIKAQPEKSDRQIAETAKVSPTTVGSVRAKMEAKGEVSKLDTRTDARGVKQPARKPASKSPPVSDDVLQKRATAAERIRGRLGRNDPGPDSAGETAPKDACEVLEEALRHARAENISAHSEIRALKAALEAKLTAISNEQFYAEFERRLSWRFSRKHQAAMKALRREFMTLDLKADPIADSEVTKH